MAITISRRLKRGAVLVGLVGVTAGLALLAAAPAQAWTGSQPGHLSFNPTSGGASALPTWTADTPCPAPFNDGAQVVIFDEAGTFIDQIGPTNPDVKVAPFSTQINVNMGLIQNVDALAPGVAYEWVLQCQDPNFNPSYVQSMWVTFTDANGNWTTSETPPQSGATQTTTSLSADPTSAAPGDNVTLTATVTPSNAAGNVEFFDGATSLGTAAVSNGTATKVVNTLSSGTHSLTAKFEPTDSTAFAESTSGPVSVSISGGGGGSPAGQETVNVSIPTPTEGTLTVTVDNTAVDMGTAADNGNGQLEATGQLSPITVNDGRNISKPGWTVSGQVGDFTHGSDVIDGNDLGWTPSIATPNTANDVTAGAAISAGSNPGLKQGGTLANAATGKGLDQTVLGGGLDLQVPTTTNPGAYSATLTITAIDTAS